MRKKLAAPIWITVLLCLWFLAQGAAVLLLPGLPRLLRLSVIVPTLLAAVMAYGTAVKLR